VTRAAAARSEVAIGHHLPEGGGIIVNPTKSERITYTDRDRIIVLARE
jgi:hypothetical protein